MLASAHIIVPTKGTQAHHTWKLVSVCSIAFSLPLYCLPLLSPFLTLSKINWSLIFILKESVLIRGQHKLHRGDLPGSGVHRDYTTETLWTLSIQGYSIKAERHSKSTQYMVQTNGGSQIRRQTCCNWNNRITIQKINGDKQSLEDAELKTLAIRELNKLGRKINEASESFNKYKTWKRRYIKNRNWRIQ